MVDIKKIEEAVKMIIEAVGEDPEREGLKETPNRIARMYEEIFSGMKESPEAHLAKTFCVEEDNLVIEKDITFYSMCEHHFLPFFGQAHIAYIPNGKVAGLSKLARTVDLYAKRPQLQENMTEQIAEALYRHLDAKAVMVVVEAEHLCISMRGIKKPGTRTRTVSTKGLYSEDSRLREETYRMIMNA
ncbi:MAG TPA: GTP cyclohydrolase I FolE [Clostridiales bacterium]|nr:GTP cyclohydrolase I FolE [Clostridiales bacterium]